MSQAMVGQKFRNVLVVLILAFLTACLPGGRVQTRIPFEEKSALSASAEKILVVVLPGRGDGVENLRASGIADAIQAAVPNADVLLTGISLAYYMEGRMPQRLHEEVIVPARAKGYREIWLTGASMGGMGALMYDRAYPGDVTGMVLLAPYLGGRDVLKEINAAGGLESWDAGTEPDVIDKNNFDRELWRYLQTWQEAGDGRHKNVWLAYGKADRLSSAMPPLQKLLDADHVLIREGGHAWVVWTPVAKEIFAAIQKERKTKKD